MPARMTEVLSEGHKEKEGEREEKKRKRGKKKRLKRKENNKRVPTSAVSPVQSGLAEWAKIASESASGPAE